MLNGTKTLLEELDTLVPNRDKFLVIESRSKSLIENFTNIMNLIKENFSDDEVEELTKKLLGSCKAGDSLKFVKKIREYKENRKGSKL